MHDDLFYSYCVIFSCVYNWQTPNQKANTIHWASLFSTLDFIIMSPHSIKTTVYMYALLSFFLFQTFSYISTDLVKLIFISMVSNTWAFWQLRFSQACRASYNGIIWILIYMWSIIRVTTLREQIKNNSVQNNFELLWLPSPRGYTPVF